MKKFLCSSITVVLAILLACCGCGHELMVDNTQPVSEGNRVIYQMNIGAFTAEGTFKSAEEHLGRLDTLGVDILWLMPIYPRGATKNSPYAPMDFCDVNASYGTLDDVRSFVAAAHERGMKVWLDWVPNHVAVENPWVSEHPEYFTRDAGGMVHPHGWDDVYELNYEDEGLVEVMNSAMKFWLCEAGVDGFRCDYVSSPTIPLQYWHDVMRELKEYKETIEFLSETDITNADNRRVDVCGFDYDYAWDFQSELANGFGSAGTQADSLRAICERMLTASKTVQNHRMVYLTNHDQNYNDGGHTLKDFYGENRYNLTVLEFTLYGMPLIYQGQEIGDPDTLNYFTDAKVKWSEADRRMLNTVRTLIALHHTQYALSVDAPVSFLTASDPHVLAYRRGKVLVVLNLGGAEANATIVGIEAGRYDQWLDGSTIADGPTVSTVSLSQDEVVSLPPHGYVVYVRR